MNHITVKLRTSKAFAAQLRTIATNAASNPAAAAALDMSPEFLAWCSEVARAIDDSSRHRDALSLDDTLPGFVKPQAYF